MAHLNRATTAGVRWKQESISRAIASHLLAHDVEHPPNPPAFMGPARSP